QTEVLTVEIAISGKRELGPAQVTVYVEFDFAGRALWPDRHAPAQCCRRDVPCPGNKASALWCKTREKRRNGRHLGSLGAQRHLALRPSAGKGDIAACRNRGTAEIGGHALNCPAPGIELDVRGEISRV